MCALLPAWLCLLLGFLPLEVQSRALTLQSLSNRHRSTLLRTSKQPRSPFAATVPSLSDLHVAVDNHITQGDRYFIWRARLHKEPPSRFPDMLPGQNDGVQRESAARRRASRGRRHANRGHGHLMRVGCVLGTCQVQNLSHRLYQLIGQSGRDDSSPINPRSPHSYG